MEYVHVELKRDTWVYPEMKINSPKDAVCAVRSLIQDLDRECVISINTATSGKVINASIGAVGTMNTAYVSPAELLRTALLSGAYGMVIVHNHPSGASTPSKEELYFNKELATASQLIGLKLLDFIVIGEHTYSLKEKDEQWLDPDGTWRSADTVSGKGERES